MNVPFTSEQFFNVFTQYNQAIWPIQILLYLAGIAALGLAVWKFKVSDRIIAAILAGLWLRMGIVYHLTFFTSINKAAYLFGGLFIVQGVLFFIVGTLRHKLSFQPHSNLYAITGAFFILYGTLIYPALGYFMGHIYPHAPTFGVPCPTTIFTFGLLLWTDRKVPKYLLVIPMLWAVIGLSAAIQWGVLEDIMLLLAGLITTAMLVYRDKTQEETTVPSLST